MGRNGNVSDQFPEFLATLVRQAPRDLETSVMQHWIDGPGQKSLRGVLKFLKRTRFPIGEHILRIEGFDGEEKVFVKFIGPTIYDGILRWLIKNEFTRFTDSVWNRVGVQSYLYEKETSRTPKCNIVFAHIISPGELEDFEISSSDQFKKYRPPFDIKAIVFRILQDKPRKVIMSDSTFRVYHPDVDLLHEEKGVPHFAFGDATGKSDEEILGEMAQMLCGSGVQFYHEDGTIHK